MAGIPDFEHFTTTILLLLGIAFLSLAYQAIWRLYFSPIANFPGPKLAALTYWYEFYYDIILPGQYIHKISLLHQTYGPIIRINPHELHILDPSFFTTLYTTTQRRDRDPFHTRGLSIDGGVLATVGHDLHRRRRAALSPFFSMQKTRTLLPLVQERVGALVKRLERLRDSGGVVNAAHMFSAFTNDVVMEFCFGHSEHRVEIDGFDPTYYKSSAESAHMVKFSSHIPWITRTVLALPDWIGVHMGSGLADLVKVRNTFKKQINIAKDPSSKSKVQRATIFHSLLESNLPESEKSDDRLINEAITLIGAGSHTVAWAMTVASYHILSNPLILRNLKVELCNVQIDEKSATQILAELEKLPYLTACLKEGLRLSYGVSNRLPLSAPDTVMRYKEWSIPAGTSVSMTIYLMHHDESIFPDSKAFKPERWLEDTERRLDKYMGAFSAGSRICLGINLAWAELYMCLMAVFKNFGGEEKGKWDKGRLELYETGLRDVVLKGDKFFPVVDAESKG